MKDLSVKQNVLQEIIDLMEAREGESLKSHPKFAKPMPELSGDAKEEMPIEGEAVAEESLEAPSMEKSEGELSEEDMQMLLQKLQEMK